MDKPVRGVLLGWEWNNPIRAGHMQNIPIIGMNITSSDDGTWALHVQLLLIRVMVGWCDLT